MNELQQKLSEQEERNRREEAELKMVYEEKLENLRQKYQRAMSENQKIMHMFKASNKRNSQIQPSNNLISQTNLNTDREVFSNQKARQSIAKSDYASMEHDSPFDAREVIEKYEQLKMDNQEKVKDFTKLQILYEQAKGENIELEKNNKDLEDENLAYEQLGETLEKFQIELDENKLVKQQLQMKNLEMEKQREELEEQMRQLEEALESEKEQNENWSKFELKMHEQKQGLEQKTGKLERELEAHKREISDLIKSKGSSMQQLTIDYEAKLKAVKSELQAKSEELVAYNNQFEALIEQIETTSR